MRAIVRCAGMICLAAVVVAPMLAAENEGLADLDEATRLKVVAHTLGDLGQVIQLCESALEKGLDEDNTKLAKTLLAATSIQRGMIVADELFDQMPPDPNWRQYRDFALRNLEKGLKIDPRQPRAQLMVAKLNLLPGGDAEQVKRALDQAIQLSTDEPGLRAAALTLRAGLAEAPEKKLADLNEALRAVPHALGALRARAGLYADQGQYDKALADLDRAVQLKPDHPGTHLLRAVVLVELKRYDEAIASLDKAHQLQPNSPVPLIQKARIYGLEENFKAALHELNLAHELAPANPTVLLLRATVYQELGQGDKALEDVDAVLARNPDHADARRLRALVLAGEGKFDAAIAEMEQLQKSQATDPMDRLRLAMFYAAGEKPQKAVDLYTKVLEQQPDNAFALRGRADALLSMGKHAQAIADYEKFLKLNPDDPGVLNNLSWVLSTSPFDQLRDGKRALELALKACELTEYKKAHILSTLAAAYAELGQFDTAIQWSQKALEVASGREKASLEKELATYKQGKPFRELLSAPEPEQEKPAEEEGPPEKHEQAPPEKQQPPDKPEPPAPPEA